MSDICLMHEHSWPQVQRGGERYLHDLGWFLQHRSDLRPHVLTARGRPRADVVEDVPVHRTWPLAFSPLGRTTRSAPRVARALSTRTGARALRRRPVSLVHALSANAALAGIRRGLPTVFTTIGTNDRGYARRNPRPWAAIADAARAADAVTAVGLDAARGLEEALGRPVIALQPGIRLAEFGADLRPRTGPPRVLFASNVAPAYKGFAAVLEAFPRVVAVHPAATLDVLGPGDVGAMIRRASPSVRRLRHRISQRVPSPQEMRGAYASYTLTVLASTAEAFGLVLAESLACGTPIVGSASGGPREILGDKDGDVGFRAEPNDPDSIAAAMLRTIEFAADDGVAARCRDRARRWDWIGEIGPRHERLYRELLGARP